MKLLLVTFGTEVVASSRTRAYQWVPHLKKSGVQVKLIPLSCSFDYSWKLDARRQRSPLAIKWFFNFALILARVLDKVILPAQQIRILILAQWVDIVYIQKALLPNWYLHLLSRLNNNLAFDFDDAIQELSETKAKLTEATIKYCKLVTVENSFNGEFSKRITGSDPLYILGPIDCDRYQPPKFKNNNKIVVGWVGSPSTSLYLDECKEPLRQLLEIYPNLEVHLIGAGANPISHSRCLVSNWDLISECDELAKFDIGIMPLPDTPWTRGKGGYKILQYMAIGIPSVVSPVGVNSTLVEPGITGFHATGKDEWFACLKELIASTDKRTTMGDKARQKALSAFSFQTYLPNLLNSLRQLTDRH